MADKYADMRPVEKQVPAAARPLGKSRSKKVPDDAQPPELHDDVHVTWRFAYIDWDAPWHWGKHPGKGRLKATFQEMAKLDVRTIGKFRNDSFKPRYLNPVSPGRLEPDAKRRWDGFANGRTEQAALYHFDVNESQERIWAALIGECLYLLWWEDDVDHQILKSRRR